MILGNRMVKVKTWNLSRKLKILCFLIGLLVYQSLIFGVIINATHCPSTDYDCQIAEIQREIDALKPAHEYNKKELAGLKTQIEDLRKRIASLTLQLKEKEDGIRRKEEDLAFAQEIFEEKTRYHYKFVRIYDPILPFLSSSDASSAFREIIFREKAASQDIKTMEDYARDLLNLKKDKENLEKNKQNLTSVKVQVESRAKFLEGEVAKTETYLASLTAKQEELLALKAGGFQTSVGDIPPTLEPCSGAPGSSNFCDPGFRPAFAAFSFGAPHRTGMSQFGAYGRAKSGQSAQEILSAYFQGAILKTDYRSDINITVQGYGTYNLEEYLKRIYEVPNSWGDNGGFEALKAQAVAARSYALAYTNDGASSICASEACQVFKPSPKGGNWERAVNETRGWVMLKDGKVAKTYYASTAGGFTISQWGWTGIKDAKDGDWPNQAYEKIAGSPWFYKAWYRSRSGASCGRSHPWLTNEEMADILNAWYVLYQGGGDVSRISPIDTNCWPGNPYSRSELASIGGFTSVFSVSVVYSNSGNTQLVNFSTNKGSISISGEEFKRAFNLRAPGYIGLKSGLFNIEKL